MRKRNIFLAAGACLAAMTLIAPLALAEPEGDPPTRVLAGTGSDTTEDFMDRIANLPPSGSRVMASYSANRTQFGNDLPATKLVSGSSNCVITPSPSRPVGSTAGVRALRDQRAAAIADGNRRPCLDFARSSANQSQATEFANTGLTWIPFAGDQVTVSTRADSLLPQTFTTAQLAAIYRCTAPGTISNPPTIVPLLPVATSGTTSFFLSAIGVTEAQLGTCVGRLDLTTNPPVPLLENKGNRMTDNRNIMPYSVAQFNAQVFDIITDETDLAEMRRVNDTIPGTALFSAAFQREVFNVVPTSELGNADVSAMFVGPNSTICTNTALIVRLGFSLLPAGRCGVTNDTNLITPGGPGIDLSGPVR